MILKEYYELYNGIKIPKIGYGTWQVSKEDAKRCVMDAIDVGYIHIDTAVAYRNEAEVGEGIRESNIKREDIFVTTKIPAEIKSYNEAVKVIEESLKTLNIQYIDLMLIHAPRPWNEIREFKGNKYYKENLEVWKALTEYYNKGLIKSIGVSNFDVDDLKNIVENSNIVPMVNQIRVHVGHTPNKVIDYCNEHNILVEAYSPLECGKLVNTNKYNIEDIAKKYNVSVPRLLIRYCLELNTLPLPKTTHKEFMIEDAKVDFNISKEDLEQLKEVSLSELF